MPVQRDTTHFDCKTHIILVMEARSEQTYCFNCIVEKHQTHAFNLSAHMLNDWTLAEEATQEAFLSAYRAFGNFRGKNLKAWLLRIIGNNYRDMLRDSRSRPSLPLEDMVLNSISERISTKESPED